MNNTILTKNPPNFEVAPIDTDTHVSVNFDGILEDGFLPDNDNDVDLFYVELDEYDTNIQNLFDHMHFDGVNYTIKQSHSLNNELFNYDHHFNNISTHLPSAKSNQVDDSWNRAMKVID